MNEGQVTAENAERAAADRAAEIARRRREFIRAHHPDRGGDTERFIAGLRALDLAAGQPPPDPARRGDPPPRVVVVPHRTLLTRLLIVAARRLRQGKPPARVR